MPYYDIRSSNRIAVKLRDGTETLPTPESGVTDVHYGDGRSFTTIMTLDTTLPAIAGGAALAVGKKLLTFPNKPIWIDAAYINVALQQTEGNVTADTPDLGLGTAIATGAVATLNGTATFENILTGQTMDDCDGTSEQTMAVTDLFIAAATDNEVYLNVADTWAADGEAAMGVTGTVTLKWSIVE